MTDQLKHFSELTESQVNGISQACIDAAIDYAKEQQMSGLSDACHNLYTAIPLAINSEWEKSKKKRKEAGW